MTRWIIPAGVLLLSVLSVVANALDIKPYSASAFAAAQQSGLPVALHFHADWCPTCRAQQKVIFDLRKQPGLDLTLFVVNYDEEIELRKKYRVMTQSTLIVFKGFKETGRVAGATDPGVIAAVLGSAL